MTVVLTTHYLEEAERLADRVGIIARGRVVAEGPPHELIAELGTTRVGFDVPASIHPTDLDRLLPGAAEVDGNRVEFVTSHATADLHRITTWAVDRGIELDRLTVTRSSLEDVFLGLGEASGDHVPTGAALDDGNSDGEP